VVKNWKTKAPAAPCRKLRESAHRGCTGKGIFKPNARHPLAWIVRRSLLSGRILKNTSTVSGRDHAVAPRQTHARRQPQRHDGAEIQRLLDASATLRHTAAAQVSKEQ
jgi:hypothetical protein